MALAQKTLRRALNGRFGFHENLEVQAVALPFNTHRSASTEPVWRRAPPAGLHSDPTVPTALKCNTAFPQHSWEGFGVKRS